MKEEVEGEWASFTVTTLCMVLYDTVTNRVGHLAVAYLLEAKEGGGGRRVGLFYCLLLSAGSL
jgi:hypothetical protein